MANPPRSAGSGVPGPAPAPSVAAPRVTVRETIPIDSLIYDAGTHVRAATDDDVIEDYAERLGEGVEFPPVVVFRHGSDHYLADGFHRVSASRRAGRTEIEAEVHDGTREDALWFALGANRAHGQRLTRKDKTHAVRLALQAWPQVCWRAIRICSWISERRLCRRWKKTAKRWKPFRRAPHDCLAAVRALARELPATTLRPWTASQ